MSTTDEAGNTVKKVEITECQTKDIIRYSYSTLFSIRDSKLSQVKPVFNVDLPCLPGHKPKPKQLNANLIPSLMPKFALHKNESNSSSSSNLSGNVSYQSGQKRFQDSNRRSYKNFDDLVYSLSATPKNICNTADMNFSNENSSMFSNNSSNGPYGIQECPTIPGFNKNALGWEDVLNNNILPEKIVEPEKLKFEKKSTVHADDSKCEDLEVKKKEFRIWSELLSRNKNEREEFMKSFSKEEIDQFQDENLKEFFKKYNETIVRSEEDLVALWIASNFLYRNTSKRDPEGLKFIEQHLGKQFLIRPPLSSELTKEQINAVTNFCINSVEEKYGVQHPCHQPIKKPQQGASQQIFPHQPGENVDLEKFMHQQKMFLSQLPDAMKRPEVQAIMQEVTTGATTQYGLWQRLTRPGLSPVERDAITNALNFFNAYNNPNSSLFSKKKSPENFMAQMQQQTTPMPSLPFCFEQHKLFQQQQQLHQQAAAAVAANNIRPSMYTGFSQRMPSAQELQYHTQSIMQNALIRKKLEENNNFRKGQQQGFNPHQRVNFQQQRSSKDRVENTRNQNNNNEVFLSPKSNHLAKWFSPELLADATAGKLPPVKKSSHMMTVDDLEKWIQNS